MPPVLEKVSKDFEELGGSYIQPLHNGARTLMENHTSRYSNVVRSDETMITDPA